MVIMASEVNSRSPNFQTMITVMQRGTRSLQVDPTNIRRRIRIILCSL